MTGASTGIGRAIAKPIFGWRATEFAIWNAAIFHAEEPAPWV